ncbi:MAG TPA: DsbA family protein [Usitatibacter sp.]|nr:DsbA family protein [Usitatibacter sp.]
MPLNLRYFADPLCSWCYGFGPELAKLVAARTDLRISLVMGGLRPYNRERMSAAFRDMLRQHWSHVSTASGLPFSQAILDREDFIYDTEPACRAVVTARQLFPAQAMPMLKSIQAAFYRDGRDATDPAVLADIAAENGYDRDTFLAAMESESMRLATRADFTATQSLGVSGFPTVAASRGEELYLVTSGYVTHDVLEYRLVEIERLTLQ